MSTFAALPPALSAAVAEAGFTEPTPVQARALPPLLAGRDLVARADTGTGKTLAFTLPLLAALDPAARRLQALVLCPTRELAAQVAGEVRRMGRRLPGLRVLVVAGGQPVAPQLRALDEGVHVVVGTPGRVVDLGRRGRLDPADLRVLVLDEADRMLEMGFAEAMEEIRAALPAARQTALFSATFPPAIEALAADWLVDPVAVSVPAAERPRAAPRGVAVMVEQADKSAAADVVLRHHQPASALVFCDTKAGAAELAAALHAAGHAAAPIHGDLDQEARDRAMAAFRGGSVRVLVATDVAARGLDVEGVDLVVNVDPPRSPEGYVHRVGRTARAGREGVAVSLVSPRQAPRLADYEALVGPIPRLAALPSPAGGPLASPLTTLLLHAGRKDKLRPGDILGALTGEVGVAGDDVGRIEIHDHRAYVTLATPAARRLYDHVVAGGKVKGRRVRVERVR